MLDFSAMKLGQSSFCHRGKPILELDSHKTFSSVVIACNHQKLKWPEDIFIYLVKRLKSYFIILIKIHRTKKREVTSVLQSLQLQQHGKSFERHPKFIPSLSHGTVVIR